MAEKKKWREESVETPKPPLVDEAFRKPALTSVTIEERRKWEAMFARFHEPHSHVLTQAQAASVIQVTNIINEVVTPASECYWVKVADDVHYLEGDVYCAYGVNAQHAILSDPTASSYVRLINPTDELRDTYVQHAAGAVTVLRWTHGLAANYERDWLLCLGDLLTTTVSEETYSLELALDGYIVVCDTGNYRVKTHLTADGSYVAKIGSNGSGDDQFSDPWGICSDGTYVYITDRQNDRIVKRLLPNLSFVAKIGSHGSGNDNFNIPLGICTDGTYLYIVDSINNRVVKRLCSDLSYVSETAGPGFNQPDYICTDGTHLYTVQTSGGTPPHRIFKNYCDDLSADIHLHDDGHIDGATITGICTVGGFLYLTNFNPGTSNAVVYKYACADLAWVSDLVPHAVFGQGETEINEPLGIATDGTNLWISDSTGITLDDARIHKVLLNGTYVSHFGTYGSGNDQFYTPRGLCISGIILRTTITPQRGPILRAVHDATSLQSYVSFHFRDECRFRENSVANDNYVAIRAPASVTSYSLTLPGTQSTGAQFLRNDGTGVLSWVTALTSVTAHNLLSATHGDTLTTAVVKGAIPYGNATPKWASLSPNTTATKKWLYETSSVPDWGVIEAADLPAHQLDGAVHSVSGLTTGHFLKATGATTFAFAAHGLTASSVGAEPALGNPGTSGWVLSSTDAGVRSWVAMSGGADHFVDLLDVPANYAGAGGKVVKVKADASGLEFVAGGAGVSSFNDLDDVPASYVGQAGKYTKVKATEDGLEYASVAGGDHDLLSATHTDTTAAAAARGSLVLGIGASPKWEAYAKGAANQVLGGDGTDTKWVTACPAAAKYIVGLAHADLSAEKVKPQLYNNYDIDDTPAAPNALDDEFDNGSLDGKWTITNAPGTRTFDETTYPGFLSAVIPETATTDVFGSYPRIHQTPPATGNFAMEFIAKVCLDMTFGATETEIGEWADVQLYLGESTHSKWVSSGLSTSDAAPASTILRQYAIGIHDNGSGAVALMTNSTSVTGLAARWVYLKLKKETTAAYTSANTYSAWASLNGLAWQWVGSCSHTFDHDCDEVGIMCRPPKAQAGTPSSGPFVDFFRRTV